MESIGQYIILFCLLGFFIYAFSFLIIEAVKEFPSVLSLITIGLVVGTLFIIAGKAFGAEPKYKAGQVVEFKVPVFYELVCSNKGELVSYLSTEKGTYYKVKTIQAKNNRLCPWNFDVIESDIKVVE